MLAKQILLPDSSMVRMILYVPTYSAPHHHTRMIQTKQTDPLDFELTHLTVEAICFVFDKISILLNNELVWIKKTNNCENDI